MGKLFGTDGIRGVVGENLTGDLAFQVGRALTTVLAEEKKHRLVIAIGKDTRISSDMLEAALMAGICAAGGDVMPFGTIPTPAVAYLTVLEKADAGIVISASHNPYEHNGIKIFDSRGYKLSDEMEERIEELILSGAPMADKTRGEIGRRFHGMRQMKQLYVQHLLSSVDCDLTGMRALVDCANGAASATAPMLFDSLHLQADFIHCDPDGVNINEHCGSTHLGSLAEGVVKGGYDLGIAFDGDADRCLLIDEKGGVVDGDKVMAVCALAIGGEQSGHTIFRDYATTGDGELTALQFLQALHVSGQPVSEFVSCCRQYPQELINVAVPHSGGVKERIMADETVWAQVREREAALAGEGRILLRPSGTEALIRVMVEAKTVELAHEVATDLADFIKKLV